MIAKATINPSTSYCRGDLSTRSSHNSKESLSSEDIHISVDSEYLPYEDESNHSREHSLKDVSPSERSSDAIAPIQQQPPIQAACQPASR